MNAKTTKADPKTTTVAFYGNAPELLQHDDAHAARLAARVGVDDATDTISLARHILAENASIMQMVIPANDAETHFLRAVVHELAAPVARKRAPRVTIKAANLSAASTYRGRHANH